MFPYLQVAQAEVKTFFETACGEVGTLQKHHIFLSFHDIVFSFILMIVVGCFY